MSLKSKLFYVYLLFLLLYAGFTLWPQPNPAVLLRYHISVAGLRTLLGSLVVLTGVIWYIALYGATKLYAYSRRIYGNKDGNQVTILARGIFVLAWWPIINSTLSAVLNYWAARIPSALPTTTIVKNYEGLVIPLAAFVLIGLGSRGLSELTKQRPTLRGTYILGGMLILVGSAYCYLVTNAVGRNHLIYQMPIGLVLFTLVVPYLFMWFTGFLSIYEIYMYRRKVPGIIYRRSWQQLAMGLGLIILITITLQYITTAQRVLLHLSLYGILAIIYALLIVIAIGYLLIALGAKRLQKIEEV